MRGSFISIFLFAERIWNEVFKRISFKIELRIEVGGGRSLHRLKRNHAIALDKHIVAFAVSLRHDRALIRTSVRVSVLIGYSDTDVHHSREVALQALFLTGALCLVKRIVIKLVHKVEIVRHVLRIDHAVIPRKIKPVVERAAAFVEDIVCRFAHAEVCVHVVA